MHCLSVNLYLQQENHHRLSVLHIADFCEVHLLGITVYFYWSTTEQEYGKLRKHYSLIHNMIYRKI